MEQFASYMYTHKMLLIAVSQFLNSAVILVVPFQPTSNTLIKFEIAIQLTRCYKQKIQSKLEALLED